MKKRILFWLGTLLITANVSTQVYAGRPTDEQIITHLQRQTPSKTPAPVWLKDGVYTINSNSPDSKISVIETVIKDGFFDEYVKVYSAYRKSKDEYQLYSHTPLVDGVPHGWSEEYRLSGTKIRRIQYQHGKIIKVEHYDDKGDLNRVLYAE